MYITGNSAFSMAYVKFILSTLVKTERLNIKIYSDTKNNILAMYIFNKNPLYLRNCVLYKSVLNK
jgi:hypothetical protein